MKYCINEKGLGCIDCDLSGLCRHNEQQVENTGQSLTDLMGLISICSSRKSDKTNIKLMEVKFKGSPSYMIFKDKLPSSKLIKINGAYLIDVGNEIALRLIKLGYDIRGYNSVDIKFGKYKNSETYYHKAKEYSEFGKLYIYFPCIHSYEVGDEFIPTDNSYNINLTTGKRDNLLVPDGENEYYRQDELERGAIFTVVKNPYFEINPHWDSCGDELNGDEILQFVHIKSSKTGYIYKCIVSQYV